MKFSDYFYEAEDKEKPEYDEEQMKIGLADEKEHDDIWEVFEKFAEENKLELPITHEEFTEMIVKAHLKKDPNYYTKEQKIEEEPVEEGMGALPLNQLQITSKQ